MRWSQPVCPSQAGTAECTLKIGSVLTVVSQSAKNAQGKLTEAIETLSLSHYEKVAGIFRFEFLEKRLFKRQLVLESSFMFFRVCLLQLRLTPWIFVELALCHSLGILASSCLVFIK